MVKGMDLVKMVVFVWIILHIIRVNVKQVLPEKTAQQISMTAWIICARYDILIFYKEAFIPIEGKHRIFVTCLFCLERRNLCGWNQ